MALFDGMVASSAGSNSVDSFSSAALSGQAVSVVNESIRSTDASAAIMECKCNPPASSILNSDGKQPDNLINVPPNQDYKIPIVYGRATVAGVITEAVSSDSNKKMTYVMTIAEMTGNLMSSNFETRSDIDFNRVFINDQRVTFKSDGITVSYTTDRIGNVDKKAKDLIKIWLYAGDSVSYVAPEGYTVTGHVAYDHVPTWTPTKNMSNLIFAVIETTYSAEKGITGLPTMKFEITNSLTQPGDVICDYMTNEMYGAGIPLAEILTL